MPSRRPTETGILPALIGSIQLAILVGLITFPLGIGAAVYLAEYAGDNRLTRLLQANISNLAGVPSIIYGIFGLAIFVRLLGFGPVLLSGAATLALVILPLVIIASFEALKAVPEAQREGAYALGAS
jgi:phosphate transport system permease protein